MTTHIPTDWWKLSNSDKYIQENQSIALPKLMTMANFKNANTKSGQQDLKPLQLIWWYKESIPLSVLGKNQIKCNPVLLSTLNLKLLYCEDSHDMVWYLANWILFLRQLHREDGGTKISFARWNLGQ